jgi:hypothetical protein
VPLTPLLLPPCEHTQQENGGGTRHGLLQAHWLPSSRRHC